MNYTDEELDSMCIILWPYLSRVESYGRREFQNIRETRDVAKTILNGANKILGESYLKSHPGVKGGISL